jgi:1-acyl-sn-glycerol-3-phosphate acyltransferase
MWYGGLHFLCRMLGILLLRVRCGGRQHVPATGGVLVMSNHQSNLDPVLVGLAMDRRLNYLARDTLFGFAPFRWLIRSLDAIPIDREGLGLAGLKETLRRLRRGELVLIFPEGTRTRDGSLQPLRPGFCAVARRAGVPLLPVALDGAFDAWPRSRRLPRLARIHVQFAPPLGPSEVAALSDDELVAECWRRIEASLRLARRGRTRRGGTGSGGTRQAALPPPPIGHTPGSGPARDEARAEPAACA